jgi:hypothetical protein
MQTKSFVAFDDDGQRYAIRGFKDSPPEPAFEGAGEAEGGLWRYETSDGQWVYIVEKGKYRIAGSGIILHTDAPDAP